MYNFSYSTIEDVYAEANEEAGIERRAMLQLAQDLEQSGVGWYGGEEYRLRDTRFGMEIVSMKDFLSESEDDEDEE